MLSTPALHVEMKCIPALLIQEYQTIVNLYTRTVISRKLWNNYMKTSLLIDFMTDDNKCLCVFCPN